MKNKVICEDDTHAGIRTWYNMFVTGCHDHGFYVHPLWLFKPDHGGNKGFTVGDNAEDDLPHRMAISVEHASHIVF